MLSGIGAVCIRAAYRCRHFLLQQTDCFFSLSSSSVLFRFFLHQFDRVARVSVIATDDASVRLCTMKEKKQIALWPCHEYVY